MTPLRTTGILLIITALILTAGCTSLSGNEAAGADVTPGENPVPASYKVTLRQPDAQSRYLQMDTDIYNIGEVVEFMVTNDGSGTLDCAGDPPAFSVKFQTPHGVWATRMGTEEPNDSVTTQLRSGASSPVYRFVTSGWDPGRYRIVHDCGIEREILLRALPPATPVPPACPEANISNTTPWIKIDPISDQSASRPFTIRGTTNLPAGKELKYTIFAVQSQDQELSLDIEGTFTTYVQEGICGNNTWSARGEIQATGAFAIGITDTERTASAIKRFTVFSP